MTDVMRQEYRVLTDEEKALLALIKHHGAELYDRIDCLEQGYGRKREFSLAKTKIEEAIMWAVKGITDTPPAGSGDGVCGD